jgi:hypothetical protein
MKQYKVKKASGLILGILNKFKSTGWTSAWNTIYLRPDQINNKQLIKHEQCHAMQMQRDGKLWMVTKYTYYLVKYGYKNNPYEIEAREVEHK